MKQLPDEQTLLELLELAKDAERKARAMSDLAIQIEQKYEKRLREHREAVKEQAAVKTE